MVAYAVLLFAVAAVFLVLGILIYRGNTSLIHDYHQANIRKSEKKNYSKAFAKVMFGITLTLIASGVIALVGESKSVVFASMVVLFTGIIASFVLLIKLQKSTMAAFFDNAPIPAC